MQGSSEKEPLTRQGVEQEHKVVPSEVVCYRAECKFCNNDWKCERPEKSCGGTRIKRKPRFLVAADKNEAPKITIEGGNTNEE